MSCTSCHDPHADKRVSKGDRNQVCATCHQDLMGPWTFEHPPAAEDCMSCHDPHGAVTSDLLETVQPVICISCHSVNDEWHHTGQGTGISFSDNQVITENFPSDPRQQVKPLASGDADEAGAFLNRCTDCHGAIHGSYTDEHLRH